MIYIHTGVFQPIDLYELVQADHDLYGLDQADHDLYDV